MIETLRYSNTNTYLIPCRGGGYLLTDTGWAGSFPMFCKALGEKNIDAHEIRYLLITHFHPDHCGIARDVAECGAKIVVFDVQKEYIHWADKVFAKDKNPLFRPIVDSEVIMVDLADSRKFLADAGVDGEVLSTPGHSDDSVSICLDNGEMIVGDLNPLYELEAHSGTAIEESWKRLLERRPVRVFYGHAKTAELGKENRDAGESRELSDLVKRI